MGDLPVKMRIGDIGGRDADKAELGGFLPLLAFGDYGVEAVLDFGRKKRF